MTSQCDAFHGRPGPSSGKGSGGGSTASATETMSVWLPSVSPATVGDSGADATDVAQSSLANDMLMLTSSNVGSAMSVANVGVPTAGMGSSKPTVVSATDVSATETAELCAGDRRFGRALDTETILRTDGLGRTGVLAGGGINAASAAELRADGLVELLGLGLASKERDLYA